MDNIRKEFIKEIMQTLKIEGVFNSGTIADQIQHIPDTQLRSFHKALFGTNHSYLNGMDRIIKVAEQFNPKQDHDYEIKAKEILKKMHGINRRISDEAEARGEDYFKLLKAAKIKESFDLDDLEVWVLNDIGGRETISKVNYFEPNSLNTKIENSVKKYYNRVENNSMQAIAGLADMKRLEK